MFIVLVLVRRVIHIYELQEDAILLELRQHLVFLLNDSNLEIGGMKESERALCGLLRLTDLSAINLS